MSVTDQTLWWAHLGAAVAHGAQAGYAFGLGNTKYRDRGYYDLTNDVRTNRVDAHAPITRYRLTNVIAAFPALSMINHLWSVSDQTHYHAFVNQGYNPVRWGEYAASASLMWWVLGQLSGITDIKTLSFMVIGNVVLQMLGCHIERDLSERRWQSAIRSEVHGFLLFLGLSLMLFLGFFTVAEKGEGRPPDMVYVIIFTLFLLMLSFGLVSIAHVRMVQPGVKKFRFTSFRQVELSYIILSLVSKSLLTNLALFGVLFSQPEEETVT